MVLKLIQIGNSKGLRLPKQLIAKYNLDDGLELVETDEGIIIKAQHSVRHNWEELIANINTKTNSKNTEGFEDLDGLVDSKDWTW